MFTKVHLTIYSQILNLSNSSQYDNSLKIYYKKYHPVCVLLIVSQRATFDKYATFRLEGYHSTTSMNKIYLGFFMVERFFVHRQSYRIWKGNRLNGKLAILYTCTKYMLTTVLLSRTFCNVTSLCTLHSWLVISVTLFVISTDSMFQLKGSLATQHQSL